MTVRHSVHHAGCGCQTHGIGRRGFLKLAAVGGGVAAASTLAPFPSTAAGQAEVLLLSCMDYRLISDVTRYMEGRGYDDNYDQMIMAGASLAAVTDKFPDWNQTFWQHLEIAIQLHGITKLFVMDHRDCGAYKVIFNKDFAQDPVAEIMIHTEVMKKLDQQVAQKYPALTREYYLMSLDTRVEKLPI
jgi:carbonic anhydrase